jgi:ACR3 family arsenite transporter
VPLEVLFYSVLAFIVIPLTIGIAARMWFIGQYGKEWFEANVLGRFGPITIVALLLMLVLIFAFQAENITGKLWHVILIAIPILLQVYLNASMTYGLMNWLKAPYSVAAPGALIGASNFFELAVATAIAPSVGSSTGHGIGSPQSL